MEAEKQHKETRPESTLLQQGGGGLSILDNRPQAMAQAKLLDTMRRKENRTGLPDALKTGVENLSGYAIDDVRVHYNSEKPVQLHAFAYTQGTDIYLAPAQEKHLPHEAWHVVQQKQGRVKPILQLKGNSVNDEEGLEREADRMGQEALSVVSSDRQIFAPSPANHASPVVQRAVGFEFETGWLVKRTADGVSLPKGAKMFSRAGFDVIADEAGEELSEIEFVTDYFDNEHALLLVMNNVTELAQEFIGSGKTSNWQNFNWHDFTITPAPEDMDDSMKAGPQYTFGNQLDKLPVPSQEMSNMGRLVGLIKIYINQAKNGFMGAPFEYPKQITDGAFLARTDFAHLLKLALEGDGFTRSKIKSIFSDKKIFSRKQWLSYFEEFDLEKPFFLGIVPGEIQRQILAQHQLMRESKPERRDEIDRQEDKAFLDKISEHTPPLKVGEWLEGIYDKVDLLAQVKDAESLGSFGKKTEIVAGKATPIFEHRLFQSTKINQSEWVSFAKERFEKVASWNGADVNDLTKPKPDV